jgi:hypothetical protein
MYRSGVRSLLTVCNNDVFQTRVGQTLRKLNHFSQGRTASHADAADVRPCLPDPVRPQELDERQGTHQERRSELLAVESEVVRQLQLLRGWRRPCSQPAFHAGQLTEDAMHAAFLNARAHG